MGRKNRILEWKYTNAPMNARDLSRDDDFISHMLVESLGKVEPLSVHKMDPSRVLPEFDPDIILNIIQNHVLSLRPNAYARKPKKQVRFKDAVDALHRLPQVHDYLTRKSQAQINAFATHISRYLELYMPGGCVEVAPTSRYTSKTGKSELCVIATRDLKPGTTIVDLKGSMADLTDEQDEALKNTGRATGGIRKDFSVIYSASRGVNHLFLGPARFVNHDCENNCELVREGRYITFKVFKHVAAGEEITAHYGEDYFGRNNRRCLCASCEAKGIGGYALADDWSVHSSETEGGTKIPRRRDNDNKTETDGTTSAGSEDERTHRSATPSRNGKGRALAKDATPTPTEGRHTPSASLMDAISNVSPTKSAKGKTRALVEEVKQLPTPSTSAAPSAADNPTPRMPSHESEPVPPPLTITVHDATDGSVSDLTELSSLQSDGRARKKPGRPRGRGRLITPPLSEDGMEIDEDEADPEPGRRRTRASRRASTITAAHERDRKGKKRAATANDTDDEDESEEEARVYSFRKRPGAGREEGKSAVVVVAKKGMRLCKTCSRVEVLGRGKHLTCGRCKRHFSIYGALWPSRVGPYFSINAPNRSRESSPERVKSKEQEKGQDHEERERRERKEAARARRSHSASPRPHKRRRTDADGEADSLRSSERRKARRGEKQRRRDAAESEDEVKNQDRGRKKKKHRFKIREPKFEPPPPLPKLITLQPSPAQFAARQLRSGIMVLAEEVSDEEHVEERVEEALEPIASDTSSDSDSDSGTDASSEEEELQLEVHVPVQSFVRRSFGLWKPGNPQSFASQRRLLDPQADLGPDPFISSFRRSRRTPSPPITILDSDEGETRATPRRATSKPAASKTKTPTRAPPSTRGPASEPVPLIKTRKSGATYTNSPRSLVQLADYKRSLRSGQTLSLREATGEDLDELHFVKIRPLKFPEPVVAIPGPADIWKNLNRRTNADKRLSRPTGTEEMTMSDDGVEGERWKVEESQEGPISSPGSPGSPTTLRMRNRPERRLLEVPTFGVLCSPSSIGPAISTSTEVLAAGGTPVARKATARMKGREGNLVPTPPYIKQPVFFAKARAPTPPFELTAGDVDLSFPPLSFAPRALRRSRSFSRVEGQLAKPDNSRYKDTDVFLPFSPFRAIIHPRARSTPPLGHYVDCYWIASRTTMFKAPNAESPPRSPFIPPLSAAADSLLPEAEIVET